MLRTTRLSYFMAVIAILFSVSSRIHAYTPSLITYQGFLTNSSGAPLSGLYSIKFTFNATPTGGTPFWTETQPAVLVTNGAFTVLLGSITTLYPGFFNDSVVYLGITVQSDPELTPRIRLTSVPYACRINSVEGAQGGGMHGSITTYGGYLSINATDYGGSAVYGYCAGSIPTHTGVRGDAIDGSMLNYGAYGLATDAPSAPSANCAGVYGRAISSHGGMVWAGYFEGWENVNGNFYAAAKFFQIDDPKKPAERTLTHSCVESNEYKNIYDGDITLDNQGKATITLPDWFETLNQEFRYQLTCVGGYAPVYIAKKVENNQFSIAGGTAGLEVSWQVTGVRKDAYAQAHPFSVVAEKPAGQRGKYLHPKEQGVSEELGVNYADQKMMEEQLAKQKVEKAAENLQK